MNRLNSCKSAILTDSVLESLFLKKIFTVKDFLEESIERITLVTSLSCKDVITVRQSLVTNYSAFPRKGIDEYEDLVANSMFLQTDIKSFDNLMAGELMTGDMIEICGLAGSGKTQFCLTVCVNVSLNSQKNVHYIDTSLGNFAALRIQNMLESRKLRKHMIKSTMERITITKVSNFHELMSVLYSFKSSLGNEENCCRLVVIDALSSLYFPLLNEANNEGLCFLNHVASLTRFISKQFHLVFLVVNLATKFFDPEATSDNQEDSVVEPNLSFKDLKPTLGRYWLHVPSTRLLIHPFNDKSHDTKRTITVLKSSSVPMNSSCIVTISDEGVMDC